MSPGLQLYQVSEPKGLYIYSKGSLTYRADTKSMDYHCQNRDNAKSKKGRVVFLVRYMSSGPVLHCCQVRSKYSKGYSSYRADMKSLSNKTKGDNSKSKKARVVNLVHRHVTSSWSTFLPSIIKIFQRVFKLQSGQEVIRRRQRDPSKKTICPPHPPPAPTYSLWGGGVGGGWGGGGT